MAEKKECCTGCKYFHVKSGKVAWITDYFCTVDGNDRFLRRFDNYTGYATNTARVELDRRCCRHFKERDA